MKILDKALLKYRIHNQSISGTRTADKIKKSAELAVNNIKRYIELDENHQAAIINYRMNQTNFSDVFMVARLYMELMLIFFKKENVKSRDKKKIIINYFKALTNIAKYALAKIINPIKNNFFHVININ